MKPLSLFHVEYFYILTQQDRCFRRSATLSLLVLLEPPSRFWVTIITHKEFHGYIKLAISNDHHRFLTEITSCLSQYLLACVMSSVNLTVFVAVVVVVEEGRGVFRHLVPPFIFSCLLWQMISQVFREALNQNYKIHIISNSEITLVILPLFPLSSYSWHFCERYYKVSDLACNPYSATAQKKTLSTRKPPCYPPLKMCYFQVITSR